MKLGMGENVAVPEALAHFDVVKTVFPAPGWLVF